MQCEPRGAADCGSCSQKRDLLRPIAKPMPITCNCRPVKSYKGREQDTLCEYSGDF